MRGAKRLIEQLDASLTRMEMDMANRRFYGSGAALGTPSDEQPAAAPTTDEDHLKGHNHD